MLLLSLIRTEQPVSCVIFFTRLLYLNKRPADPPDLILGRYTDAFKSKAQLAHWERAMRAYESGRVLEACRALLLYWLDEPRQNVRWQQDGDTLRFSLLQGSQRIEGQIEADYVRAESKVAQAKELSVGFMRRLMEHNCSLKFCRFALDPNNVLVLCFEIPLIEASPTRLHQALRELALWADKQDDLLVDEFSTLIPITFGGKDLPEAEKAAKYAFITCQIRSAFDLMDKGPVRPEQRPGVYAYLLLSVIYRIDYLVRPEGVTMDILERASRSYFSRQEQPLYTRVLTLRRELQKILDRPREQVLAELYRTEATFGLVAPLPFERLVQLIENERNNMEWALEKGYDTLAMAVPQYLVSYTLFHYVPPEPVYDLLRLFLRVTESEFFDALGLPIFTKANGSLHRSAVLVAIEELVAKHRKTTPNFKPKTQLLDFSSMPMFGKTFLELICRLELSR